ncbi:hypothetical protein L249_8750 [Ophiocordyceps polyrhachis-furcata BCC 54312]|uniref:Uncharacterized protein n=1 Tax=Ophiocordyceps polyrhachis-furcata BCC 54312 TaxID=1330021 RepID=A0A367L669_9HYPO|nr:hypothetical protein L249_8750 [Ophiocordyceps polyrhachis-furcata BCC 54312]
MVPGRGLATTPFADAVIEMVLATAAPCTYPSRYYQELVRVTRIKLRGLTLSSDWAMVDSHERTEGYSGRLGQRQGTLPMSVFCRTGGCWVLILFIEPNREHVATLLGTALEPVLVWAAHPPARWTRQSAVVLSDLSIIPSLSYYYRSSFVLHHCWNKAGMCYIRRHHLRPAPTLGGAALVLLIVLLSRQEAEITASLRSSSSTTPHQPPSVFNHPPTPFPF